MDKTRIKKKVSIEFRKWEELQKMSGWEVEITEGAIHAIAQMVINIEEDPSDSWQNFNPDTTQQYAISTIPNVLNDILFRHRRGWPRRQGMKVTSWEIWHGISNALDSWCPIPKEF
jgi:hypothetical protein